MAFGDITATLRPIKFAFLVNPLERKEVDRVIRISLFLWGGLHNPIIPIYRRLPPYWSDLLSRRRPTPKICNGYIRTFDPDAVVVCGNVDKAVIPGNIQHVVTLDQLVGDLGKEDAPALGVGLFEVLADFAKEQFRYVRRDGMKLVMPTYGESGSTLFRAVFGEVPAECRGSTYDSFLKAVEAEQPHVALDNFLQIIRGSNPFLSSLCTHKLDFYLPRAEQAVAVLLLNHENTLDVIDFWNLRAIGWYVLPIPAKLSKLDDTLDFVRRFIERNTSTENNIPTPSNARLLKARSIPEAEFMEFVNSIPRTTVKALAAQTWYPPMWDEFARRGGRLPCCTISSGQAQTQVSDDSAEIRIKALAPDFMASNLGHGVRYANDIQISIYGRCEFGAEVLPPFEKSVSQLFGVGLWSDWRVGPKGPTFLGHYSDQIIQLNQPSPHDVVALTLADHGWKNFGFSSPGNVAYQMMRHLGGPHKIGLIKNLMLIRLLESLAAGRNVGEESKIKNRIDTKFKEISGDSKTISVGTARTLVWEEVERALRSPVRTGDVVAKEFRGNISRIANSMRVAPNVDDLIEEYTKAKIFSLGVQVQCSVCEQHSWHSIDRMNYELECPICLSTFKLPVRNTQEIKWSYKSLGPFALPKQAFGAYSVLLTVNFLRTHHRPATTPIFSFHAQRNGEELEADFMMFYRGSAFWERETETIFGECKSFNGLAARDIHRMKVIAADNPGAVIVFATLADEFSLADKKLLKPFVQASRKYGELDRPKNPVLLLTGKELFSTYGPPQCWKDAGGTMEKFATSGVPSGSLIELCDATQQLYLDLTSWRTDWTADFERRRTRSAK
jgi:hypothetical protein